MKQTGKLNGATAVQLLRRIKVKLVNPHYELAGDHAAVADRETRERPGKR